MLELKERRGDKHSTIADYRNMTKRIYPEIGYIKLRDLRPDHLNSLYAKLAKDGMNKRTGGKLSNKTILRFVFCQDNGSPMHPCSVTTWLARFSDRHGLPHINPHAFRHTMTSLLFFCGVDSVSISKRLGHSQVSTTTDIYAHVMEEADKRNADVLGEILLKKA